MFEWRQQTKECTILKLRGRPEEEDLPRSGKRITTDIFHGPMEIEVREECEAVVARASSEKREPKNGSNRASKSSEGSCPGAHGGNVHDMPETTGAQHLSTYGTSGKHRLGDTGASTATDGCDPPRANAITNSEHDEHDHCLATVYASRGGK
eukprot:TRINITY_DN34431_c0_g2_i1.p1 TRINITY_DN34431_c0_g2~~TRINITY_DN34431_c0_g2_i1.p1  ORF type:complete len:152 (-),score=22.28 TRINITY_DN34431_c0_g2_i1:50-505(-)